MWLTDQYEGWKLIFYAPVFLSLMHVVGACSVNSPCFTGLLQYSHEKGEKGGSLSFKFNLVDPEGNKLIDQSFFISVLGRPPPGPVTYCTHIKAQMFLFFSLRRGEGNYCRFIPLSCMLADALHLGHFLIHTVTFCSNRCCCVVNIQHILCAKTKLNQRGVELCGGDLPQI